MPFFDDCDSHFKTKDLYEIFAVEKSATESEIKKAYRKLSLTIHPDRVSAEEKKNATVKFQILSKVYSILSNKEKRAIYDETGSVDDDVTENIDNWLEFWRLLFPNASLKAKVEDYSKKYWGSDKEKADLKNAYLKHKGDLNMIIVEEMFCNILDDEPRYKRMIQEWIDNNEVPAYKAFTNEKKTKTAARKRRFMKEKKMVEEEEAMKDLSGAVGTSASSLESIIATRTKERRQMQDDFFSHLEAKYAKPKKTKTVNKKKSKIAKPKK